MAKFIRLLIVWSAPTFFSEIISFNLKEGISFLHIADIHVKYESIFEFASSL